MYERFFIYVEVNWIFESPDPLALTKLVLIIPAIGGASYTTSQSSSVTEDFVNVKYPNADACEALLLNVTSLKVNAEFRCKSIYRSPPSRTAKLLSKVHTDIIPVSP